MTNSNNKPSYEELLEENLKLKEKLSLQNDLLLSEVFKIAPIGVGIVKDAKITFVNNEILKMLGYEENELLNSSTDILFASQEELHKLRTIKYPLLEKEKKATLETKYKTKTGEILDIVMKSSYLNGQNLDDGVITTVQDITKLKKIQENLFKVEEKFTKAFRFSPISFCITKLKDGTFIDVNQSFCNLFEYTREDLIGKNAKELNIFQNINRNELVLNLDFKNIPNNIEMSLLTKTKKELKVLISSELLETNNETHFFSIIVDLTERKKIQQNLLESENKYHCLVEHASDAIFVSDAKGNYTEVNSAACKMLGYSKEELLTKNFVDLIPPEDLITNPIRFSQLYNGESLLVERNLLRKDQVKLFVEISATVLPNGNLLGIARDITERKAAELKTKESEEKFSKIFQLSPDVITITSIETGKFIEVNKRFFEFSEYTYEETIGKTALELELWLEEERSKVLSILMKKGQVENMEFQFQTKYKKSYTGLVSCEIIEINNNKYILSVIRDITSQKQIQNKLNDERIRLKTLIETLPDHIFLKDINGFYLTCNKMVESFFGAKEIDIIGKTDFDFLPEDVAKAFRTEDNKVIKKNEQITILEWINYKSDGHKKLLQTIKTPMYDSFDNIIGVLGIGRDITQLYESQEQINNREKLYSAIINQANDAIVLFDPKTGEFLEFNETAYKSLGYTREEFKQMRVFDINPLIFSDQVLDDIEILEEKGQSIFETKHRCKNGTIKDVRVSSCSIYINNQKYFSSIWSDITDLKKIEKNLRKSEKKLNEAQHLAKIGNWDLNLITNKLFWSNEMYNIFAVAKKDFKESYEAFLNAIHPDDYEFVNKVYTDSLKNKTTYDIVHRLLMKDGKIKYVNEKCYTEYNKEGTAIRSVGTTQDVTERILYEQEIKQLNEALEAKVEQRTEELEKANKDLEAFAYSVSHDLRAPLRHIDAFTKLLKSNIKESSEDIEKYLNKITKSSAKMSKMIDDLLKFSRLGRKGLTKTEVDLNLLVKELIEQYKVDIWNRKVTFIVEQLPKIQGDYGLLQIVFENLISNAIKFTSKKEQALIEIAQFKSDTNEYNIYIKDNGVGFDMNYAGKLFGVFQRLHAESDFSGTGIGLANIKQIIQKHGGTIWAEGEVDKGSTFYLCLK